MRLTDLEPHFLAIETERSWRRVEAIGEADGVLFLCPVCFTTNKGNVGTHSVICWRPKVPQTVTPGPGRWELLGSGYHDLTLRAGSSSVFLTGPGCGAHFYINNGMITSAMSNWQPS